MIVHECPFYKGCTTRTGEHALVIAALSHRVKMDQGLEPYPRWQYDSLA